MGVCVAFKRLLLGLVLGRQTFIHYGEQLANVLKNMVLVGEVATLAKEIEKYADEYSFRENKITSDQSVASTSSPGGFVQNIQEMVEKADEEAQKKEEKQASSADAAKSFIAKRNAVPEAPKSPEAPMPPQLGPESGDTDSDSGVMEADPDFTQSEQMKMMELLDAWEEPTTAEEKEVSSANVIIEGNVHFAQCTVI